MSKRANKRERGEMPGKLRCADYERLAKLWSIQK